jgi:glyoxylase-like metal-dependent hydrolase (beta-lactamase superfamily II)
MEIAPGLHAFIWRSTRANNANTYLIAGKEKKILIDPGHLQLFDHVQSGLAGLKLRLDQIDAVLITHAHVDHMEAAGLFRKPTLWAMSREAIDFLKEFSGWASRGEQADFFLAEGDLKIGDITLKVIATPGHSPGSVCFYWPDCRALFTGDVIFNQGIGRVDLPGGSGKLLKQSIQRLSTMDVDILLPGHGAPVVKRTAVRENFKMVEDYWFNYLDQ